LQYENEKLTVRKANDNHWKDELLQSYRYTIDTQNATITELNNRIVDLKIVNQIAINFETIRSDMGRLSYFDDQQFNDSVKFQLAKISKLESDVQTATIKLQECQNLTTDTSIKEIERKIDADELVETQSRLSECNSRVLELECNTKLREKATRCSSFGYESGIHEIQLPGLSPISVLCNGEIAGPGWIVIHQRSIGDVDFFKTWNEYKDGFGNMDGDYFIGLEKLYLITNYEPYELYVQLEKFDGSFMYARYNDFVIGNELEKYALKSLGEMTGTAGDFLRNQEHMKFSTMDQDNDNWTDGDSADKYHGGWWYPEISGR